MDTKYCPDCGQHRPMSAFYKIASRYDGLSSYCIEHQLLRDREHKKKRRDAYRARNKSYMREYRAKQAALLAEKAAPKQPDMFKPEPTGPRCACGNVLHSYDVKRGKCIQCIRHGITRARETRPSVTAAMTPAPATGD
jgi:hypothetical protein